jgi:TPR repeat protein
MHQFHIVGEHSDSDVMLVLGLCYGFGTGVPQDFEQSVSWYHRAARLGNIDAMACLSACYRDGIGIRKDTREANRWLRRAKKAGEAAVDQPG